ncbi:HDOD domain-containing protein [Sanguibacter sp. HDW7]|uniref:HDOD domain-containing protein n=1 Tax=Sanguibacter sp. HDW7 TaxID=2714931 RepID=UPI00140BECE2|nr:HDOD domain-containing protein [Sanguibacter sp. HDW7]QIK84321.1 HDOD domain-containing protein [Sanguibacter sp. HDW7]
MNTVNVDTDIRFVRMPMYDATGVVTGYFVTPSSTALILRPDLWAELELAYLNLDLPRLALDRTVFLVPTPHMVEGKIGIPRHAGRIALVVTPLTLMVPNIAEHLVRLRRRGYLLVLGVYRGTENQLAMLELFTHVLLDQNLTTEEAARVAVTAAGEGAVVVAPRLVTEGGKEEPVPGVSVLLGTPTAGVAVEIGDAELLPNEVACLEAVRLLGEAEVDVEAVGRVLGADPALVLRVLRLVNGAATGLSHRVDSVRRAIVLLGPVQVQGLVMASLVASTSDQIDNLWLLIARGITCERLSPGSESAYTVGLLSALSTERGIPAHVLAERTRLSDDAYGALVLGEGPLGHVLQAVVAHERNDFDAVTAMGIEVDDVTRAYFDAIPEALDAVLTALTPSGAEL